MSGTQADIRNAEAQAGAARIRMQVGIGRLKNRLNPAVRARELITGVRDKSEVLADDAIEVVYERPRMIASVIGAIALLVLRRPVARLIQKSFHRRSKWDEPRKWDVKQPRNG